MLRNDALDRFGHCIEHSFADEIGVDDQRDFADGFWRDDGTDVFALFVGEEREVELGDDGVAAVGIDDADEGVDAAGFVHVATGGLVFAEVEDLVAEAVAFLQYPEVFQR